jgi:hypothetical protein
MTNLNERFSEDLSSELSLTPSQSVSQSSGSFTNLPHAGGDAFSTESIQPIEVDDIDTEMSIDGPDS